MKEKERENGKRKIKEGRETMTERQQRKHKNEADCFDLNLHYPPLRNVDKKI